MEQRPSISVLYRIRPVIFRSCASNMCSFCKDRSINGLNPAFIFIVHQPTPDMYYLQAFLLMLSFSGIDSCSMIQNQISLDTTLIIDSQAIYMVIQIK